MQEPKPRLLITGISGFLGSHLALTFLKDGTYSVRGSVRSLQNTMKIEPLRKEYGALFGELEIVQLELTDRDSIFAAVKGCQYVVHSASPFPLLPPKHESEVIIPAVNGTKYVLEACVEYGVKRLVITSAYGAVSEAKPKNKPKSGHFNESHWSDTSYGPHISAYEKSKTLAEKLAWEFVNKLPAD